MIIIKRSLRRFTIGILIYTAIVLMIYFLGLASSNLFNSSLVFTLFVILTLSYNWHNETPVYLLTSEAIVINLDVLKIQKIIFIEKIKEVEYRSENKIRLHLSNGKFETINFLEVKKTERDKLRDYIGRITKKL